MMLEKTANGMKIPTFQRPGFRRQLSTLLWRDAMVAIRDPTLYYLQVGLSIKHGVILPVDNVRRIIHS